MEMEYDFTSSLYQPIQNLGHLQQENSHLQATTDAGFQGQYINHLIAQSQVSHPHIPNRPDEQGQAQGHPLHHALGIAEFGVGDDCAVNAAPARYNAMYNQFKKGFDCPVPGTLPTPQGSDSILSPPSFGDIDSQQSPSYGRTNSLIGTAGTATTAPYGSENAALYTANGNGVGPAATQDQLSHPHRGSVSNGSLQQQRQSASGDEAAMSNTTAEKGISSGEDKDDTVQSRRKAQNRAAQRAFRERKEQRVRDLELELAQYKEKLASMLEDNELLKRQISQVNTENEILKATSHHRRRRRHRHHSSSHRSSSSSGSSDSERSLHKSHQSKEPTETGPLNYSPMDYVPEKPTPPNVCPKTGERLLNPSELWDMIVQTLESHGLDLDVQDIHDKLRLHMVCDGKGPVVAESLAKKAIEQSILEGQGGV